MKKFIMLLICAFTIAPLISHQAAAQQTINTNEYSGKVLKVEGDKLTIDTSEGAKEFTVPNNIRVERNSSDVSLDQLKAGDKVTVRADGSDALSVSSTAGSLIDKLIKAAVVAAVALVVLFLIWRMIQRRNKGFIKTTPTNLKGGE